MVCSQKCKPVLKDHKPRLFRSLLSGAGLALQRRPEEMARRGGRAAAPAKPLAACASDQQTLYCLLLRRASGPTPANCSRLRRRPSEPRGGGVQMLAFASHRESPGAPAAPAGDAPAGPPSSVMLGARRLRTGQRVPSRGPGRWSERRAGGQPARRGAKCPAAASPAPAPASG